MPSPAFQPGSLDIESHRTNLLTAPSSSDGEERRSNIRKTFIGGFSGDDERTITPPASKELLGLGAATVAGLLMCGLLFHAYVYHGQPDVPIQCTSDHCKFLAEVMMSKMNATADPCEDFYEYACGGWVKEHPLPSYRETTSTKTRLSSRILYTLKDILEHPKDLKGTALKAVDFYNSCMDTEKLDELGAEPLQHMLSNVSWESMSDSWQDPDRTQLAQKLALLSKWGIEAFVGIDVEPDANNSAENAVYLRPGDLLLPALEYFGSAPNSEKAGSVDGDGKRTLADPESDDRLIHLRNYIDKLVKLSMPSMYLFFDADRALAIIRLEQQIASEMVNGEDLGDIAQQYNPTSVEKFDSGSRIAWKAFLNGWFTPEVRTRYVTSVVVTAPAYFSKLSEILDTTSVQTVTDYLQIRVVAHGAQYLSKEFRDALNGFKYSVKGAASGCIDDICDPDAMAEAEEVAAAVGPARWKICTRRTNYELGMTLGIAFAQSNFSTRAKRMAEHMVEWVKRSYKKALNATPWMDNQARGFALDKIDRLITKLGYPKALISERELQNFYRNLVVTNSTYFANELNAMNLRAVSMIRAVMRPVDSRSWGYVRPASAYSSYSQARNLLLAPAGFWQPPFFYENFIDAANFGGAGSLVAHAFMHGFDESGIMFDSNGNMKSAGWWSPAVMASFKAKTDCFEKQYSEYVVGGRHVDGKLTLSENIADNGGLQHAYAAYKDYVMSEHQGMEEIRVPGLSLTQPQMFFVSFGTTFCSISTPEKEHLTLLKDTHSPSKVRLHGAVSNSEDFARAFNCPTGRPMSPARPKCSMF